MRADREKRSGTGTRLLFLVYVAGMLWLLFGQRVGEDGVSLHLFTGGEHLNLEPLQTLKRYVWLLKNSTDRALLRHAAVNLVGNVVLFIPLGWFLPCLWERLHGFFRMFFTVALLIVLVEVIQYITLLGSCDIDDLLLNLVGAVWGYGIWKIGTFCRNRK